VTTWRWVIGPWYTPPQRELSAATGRQFTVNLTAPATATFDLPGRSPEAAYLDESTTDLWIYADETLAFRGRVIGLNDTVTATVHTTTVTCTDYRGLLTRRLLVEGDQLAWSTPRYYDIAWGLISLTQAKPNGSLGIFAGVTVPDAAQPPSNYRVRNYTAGDEIGKTLDDLAAVAFDYQISPGLSFDYWAPNKRDPSGFVADLGGTVAGFTRYAQSSTWANVVRVSAKADTTTADVIDNSGTPGRFEQQIGFPDVVDQSTLDQRAPAAATAWAAQTSTLTVDLRPDVVSSTADVNVGQVVTVALRSGRLNIVEPRTINQITVKISDSGAAHTTLGFL
jgi:hypothetical protein